MCFKKNDFIKSLIKKKLIKMNTEGLFKRIVQSWLTDCIANDYNFDQKLDLSNLDLDLLILPEIILHHVKYLDCSGNKLNFLPNGMTNLKCIDCSNNKIIRLPNDMINVEYIVCENNKMICMPNNTYNLKAVWCDNNDFNFVNSCLIYSSDIYCNDYIID